MPRQLSLNVPVDLNYQEFGVKIKFQFEITWWEKIRLWHVPRAHVA